MSVQTVYHFGLGLFVPFWLPHRTARRLVAKKHAGERQRKKAEKVERDVKPISLQNCRAKGWDRGFSPRTFYCRFSAISFTFVLEFSKICKSGEDVAENGGLSQ